MDETPPPKGGPLPPPTPTSDRRHWYDVPVARDRDGGKIAGVIGGLGRSYGFELRLVRVLFALACLFFPSLILVYIGAWIVFPADASRATSFRAMVRQMNRMSVGTLVLLSFIALTVVVTLDSPFHARGVPWGVALIVIGVLLWLGTDRFGINGGPTVPATPSAAPVTTTGTFRTPPAPGWAPAPPMPSSWDVPARAYPITATAPQPTRPRIPVFRMGAAATFAGVGAAALGDLFDWWHLSITGAVITSLLVLIGLALVSAGVNRSVAPLGLVGPLALATTAMFVLQPSLTGGVGQRTVTPATTAEAEAHQRLAAGRLTVDLRDLAADPRPVTVDAKVGFGQLQVLLPAGATVELHTLVGGGRVVVDGREVGSGTRVHVDSTEPAPGAPTAEGRPTVVIDAEIGAGEIAVERDGTR